MLQGKKILSEKERKRFLTRVYTSAFIFFILGIPIGIIVAIYIIGIDLKLGGIIFKILSSSAIYLLIVMKGYREIIKGQMNESDSDQSLKNQ